MTQQLEEIIERLHHLDLTEEEEQRIVESISATLEQIEKPHNRKAEAAARMRERRKGNRLPEGLTVRDMVEAGRR